MEEMEKYYQICVRNKWSNRAILKYIQKHNLKEKEFKQAVFMYLTKNLEQKFYEMPTLIMRFLVGSDAMRYITQYEKVIKAMGNQETKSVEDIIGGIYTNESLIYNIMSFIQSNMANLNYDLLAIENLLKNWNLDFHDTCVRVARFELARKVSVSEVEEHYKYLLKEKITTITETLTDIRNAANLQEVINIFDNSILNVTTLINKVNDYAKEFSLTEEEKEELLEKLKYYNEYQSKKLEYDRKYGNVDMLVVEFKEGKKLLEEYIEQEENVESQISFEEFLKAHNLTNKQWEYYLNLIKLKDKKLYKKYQSLTKPNSIADTILYYLQSGIEDNGTVRPFNILDYYMITNLSFNELYEQELKGKCNKQQLYLFRCFFSRNKDLIPLNERSIRYFYEDKLTVNVEFDAENMPIIGSGHVVTKEEKDEIINFLKEHNCLYDKTLALATKRFFSKKQEEKQEEKVKKLVNE